MRIVVVEDEKKTRDGLVRLISRLEGAYEVVGAACSGVEGFMLIKTAKPDLVITDVKLPTWSGLEMLRRLKEAGVMPRTVILSGYAEFQFAKQAIGLGVRDYLLKPVTAADFRTILARMQEEMGAGQPEEHRREASGEAARARAHSLLVKRAVDIVHTSFREPLSLAQIAERLNVSPSYLSTLFGREVGCCFSIYLRNLRIGKAKELLLGTQLKSYEIAQAVGYADSKYFCRVFRQATGMSPRAFVRLNT